MRPELPVLRTRRELPAGRALRAPALPAVRPRGPLPVGAALRAGSLRVALALLTCVGSGASAQDALAAADRAYEEGRLREAARAYDDAVRGGGLEPADLVRAHTRLGVLRAMAGDGAGAERHFAIALALDPARDAPEELDPELRARFEAVREARDGRRVALAIDAREGALFVEVRDAPRGLALAVQIEGASFRERHAWNGAPVRVEPPPGSLPIEAVLLDGHGNRLARAGARSTPAVLTSTDGAGAPAEARGGHGLLESPWLWVAVGAIVIGVGVGVAVTASGDRYLLQAPVVR